MPAGADDLPDGMPAQPHRPGRHRRLSRGQVRERAEAQRILGDPMSGYEIADRLSWIKSLPMDVDEATFQSAVVKAATSVGLLSYHTVDSRKSKRGFPDLGLVGWGGLALWELKVPGGRVLPDQKVWNFALNRIAQHSLGLIHVAIYYPADFTPGGPIVKELTRLARPPKHIHMRSST